MISFLAPIFAVIFGVLIVLLHGKSKPLNLRLFLAFSGAFLLSVLIFELFPELYEHQDPKQMGLFILLGILLQIVLEFFSKGAEHGHVHLDTKSTKIPWMLFVSLSIHAFLEGIPVVNHHHLLYGIVIHKITIAVILSIFILKTNIKFYQALLVMTLFSIMTPLGSLFYSSYPLPPLWSSALSALVTGVLLHIATVILFESSEGHSFNLRKILVIVLGITTAYFL